MSRRLTGFTPSGHLHLGNYFGAIRPIIAGQHNTPPTPSSSSPTCTP